METNIKVLTEALKRIGIKGMSGKTNNSPSVVEWLKRLIPGAVDDEVNWCSAFAHDVVTDALGIELPQIDASARSWLKYGIPTETPQMGDMVIFWREDPQSWKGHIAIYIRDNGTYVWVLGGNQSNMVSISPYEKSKVLGYRKHEGAE